MNLKQTETKKVVSILASFILMFCIIVLIQGCPNKDEEPENKDIWDIDKDGIPGFVETNYIELEKIYRISKFRSSIGHDYSDGFEQCRSMKHLSPRIHWRIGLFLTDFRISENYILKMSYGLQEI